MPAAGMIIGTFIRAVHSTMLVLTFMLVMCLVAGTFSAEYPPPNPTFEANSFTTWTGESIRNSRKAKVYVPFTAADGSSDMISVLRVDLVGDDYERGYAHGYLLAKEIIEFQGPQLNKYFMQEVMSIDLSNFPEPLQKILRVIQIEGAIAAPAAFRSALAWVWETQKSYAPDYIKSEIAGMGEGLCAATKIPNCNSTAWSESIAQLNMLPELIRMKCTAYGAWGKATPEAQLVQLRALDFGGGPFANYTIAAVYRDAVDTPESNAFVSITFPGFAGAITGMSQRGIGLSQKVWTTYDGRGYLPGSFQGETCVFVLRNILQKARTRGEAEDYLRQVNRTWAIWIGIGDYSSNVLDLVGYQQASVGVYTDETMPTMTGQPYLESVCYVDKHQQPTADGPNGTLPTALTDFYGNITLENSKSIAWYHQTGDLHIATYDFSAKLMNLAVGRINHQGQYYPTGGNDTAQWRAYNRPYLQFSLEDLWAGK